LIGYFERGIQLLHGAQLPNRSAQSFERSWLAAFILYSSTPTVNVFDVFRVFLLPDGPSDCPFGLALSTDIVQVAGSTARACVIMVRGRCDFSEPRF
jgi:hypothetical protein